MKRVAVLVAIAGGFVYVETARALEYQVEAGAAWYQWKEHTSVGIPKEHGPMLSLGGWVSGYPLEEGVPRLTLRGDVELFVARVRYDTFLQPPLLTPVATYSDYVGSRYEGSLGWRFPARRARIEPFVGLASRWWLRYVESSGVAQGYPEQYQTIYGRIGLRGVLPLGQRLTFHAGVSHDPMLLARERVDLSDISGEVLSLKNGREAGWTAEGGVRSRTLDLTVYGQATRFGKSNEVSCLGVFVCFQPPSDQNIVGLRVGFTF